VRCSRRVLAGESFRDVVVVDGTAYETHYTPLRNDKGEVVGAGGFSVDVTARVAVEAPMRDNEEKLKRIFESSLDAIVIADVEDGRYLEVNNEFFSLTGYTREEVLGRTATELGIWTDPGDLAGPRRQIRERGMVRNVETPFRMKNGTVRWGLFSSVVIELSGQRRLLSFVRDITERRHTEAELRELSGRLLQLQDQERRRIALELHDSTAQTLAALAMNLALVRKSKAGSDASSRRALDAATKLADQCSQEIRTLSYLLHPPLLEEMGLISALRAYADGFAERSGIQVALELPSESDRLPRDVETTLFRIAQESLTNIHRHSGSPTARIRVRRTSSHVTLEVRDYGRGIPSSVLEGSSEVKSLGVGITGMRARVRQLGGSLDVSSRARGAAIKVILPVRRSAA
ncbi:MAG: PAS domain S-box protein, partial [Candidatus Binatia bacterium]